MKKSPFGQTAVRFKFNKQALQTPGSNQYTTNMSSSSLGQVRACTMTWQPQVWQFSCPRRQCELPLNLPDIALFALFTTLTQLCTLSLHDTEIRV